MTNAAAYCSSAREVQFLEVWNSLIGRSTTQLDDFHCIVANLLDFSVQELFALKRSDRSDQENRHERMKAIILAQQRLPMQLFCLPITQANNIINEMAWLPERPIGPRLSDDAFVHSVKVVHKGFVMERACLASCFFAWPLHSSAPGFCLNIPSKNGVHPHVTLDLPRNTSIGNSDLLVYLNASIQAHTLLTDSRKNGAAFFVIDRQNDAVKVKYLCSLSFRNCWKVHGSFSTPDYIPAAAVCKVSVCISGPDIHTALKFRRPLRVGSNLIATLLAKVLVIVMILSLITAISLAAIFSLRTTRKKFFFKWTDIPHSTLPFYASLIALFLYYVTALFFVCARYMSTPWVRKSYLTDQLPWHVRALYWEKLPSILKITMWVQRMPRALVACFLPERRTPYEIQTGRPRRECTTLLWRLKRLAMSPWRRTQNANGLPQDYTDDYHGDIPLLLSSELDPASRDVQASSSHSPPLDLSGVDAFHYVGEENARILRTVQRAFIATRADETGDGIWDGFRDGLYAGLWIARMRKRRKLRDILFDFGLIRGRR
ncbi:hypothetical protein K469DRAFT_751204 [Zopfia rhizophila CBS 207.26]|uniref:Uncharacterized protein n=1 Tax=Zopfia rhizophila CBS 207.26 TaxID=1314779 RepID=A0A6A6E0V5_9PEZI|nr:hypothetical protein K469DRAFT_751204 [Zopfia rhizophila CBS 207.26]